MTEDLIEPKADAPPLDAKFDIEGPDGDGYVWICSTESRQQWCHNLGSAEAVTRKLSRWLSGPPASPIGQ